MRFMIRQITSYRWEKNNEPSIVTAINGYYLIYLKSDQIGDRKLTATKKRLFDFFPVRFHLICRSFQNFVMWYIL